MAKFEKPGFGERFDVFLGKLSVMVKELSAKNYPSLELPEIDYEVGNRYVKVIRKSCGSRSVHCFVDKSNGDVLKAASWKAPAKHARSNIFSDDYGMSGVGEYGANYL